MGDSDTVTVSDALDERDGERLPVVDTDDDTLAVDVGHDEAEYDCTAVTSDPDGDSDGETLVVAVTQPLPLTELVSELVAAGEAEPVTDTDRVCVKLPVAVTQMLLLTEIEGELVAAGEAESVPVTDELAVVVAH